MGLHGRTGGKSTREVQRRCEGSEGEGERPAGHLHKSRKGSRVLPGNEKKIL